MQYNEHVIKIKKETEWLQNNQDNLKGTVPTAFTKLHLAAEHLQAEINFLESEIVKLKDGYKVALELVETARKEKEEAQETLRRRNAEVTRLKHKLSMGLPIIEYESYLSPEDKEKIKEKIKEMLSNTKPGVVFEVSDKITAVLLCKEAK